MSAEASPSLREKAENHIQVGEQQQLCRIGPGTPLDILFSTFCLTVPMLLLTAALLTIIWLYKVDNSAILPVEFEVIRGDAIYVRADSTLLVFIASWMSSIVPFLTAFAIGLAAYPIAQQLLRDSNDDKHTRLLTPFQLSIVIKFMNGSTWGSLLNLFQYCIHWNTPLANHGAALVSITMVTLITVILGIVVLAADTWLHIATKSVNVISVSGLLPHEATYSLSIQPQCLSTNNSFYALKDAGLSCSVSTGFEWPSTADIGATLQTLNNRSDTLTVLNNPHDVNIQYLSPVSSLINSSFDYTATTFAASTVCKPISSQCGLVLTNNATFNCSDGAFWSDGQMLSLAGVERQSYRYSDMSDYWDTETWHGLENPFFTAGASLSQLESPASQNLLEDPGLAVADEYVIAGVFLCNTTVFDAEYTVRQGRVMDFTTQVSNTSVTNMFSSGVAWTSFGNQNILIAMQMAAPVINTAQDYADAFAEALTSVTLAAGSASIRPSSIVRGEKRDTLLLSQVPKAPLFLLVGVNLSFVILGFVLAILATLTSHEARAVQFRLSIAGIVAGLFEGSQARGEASTVEQLFGEYHGSESDMRIKMHRTSTGGFIFKSMGHDSNIIVDEVLVLEDESGWNRGRRRFPSHL